MKIASPESKIENIIYKGLGFPIKLNNVPMKKAFGEWVLDINFNRLQKKALQLLIRKSSLFSGGELRFIRHYLEMSSHTFAKRFGVTHAAVLKWESEESKMNPSTEICIRLYVLNYLKVSDKEFRKVYLSLTSEFFNPTNETDLLEIDIKSIHTEPDKTQILANA